MAKLLNMSQYLWYPTSINIKKNIKIYSNNLRKQWFLSTENKVKLILLIILSPMHKIIFSHIKYTPPFINMRKCQCLISNLLLHQLIFHNTKVKFVYFPMQIWGNACIPLHTPTTKNSFHSHWLRSHNSVIVA